MKEKEHTSEIWEHGNENLMSPELYELGLRNPLRTATLEPTLGGDYKVEPRTFKQRIKDMDLGYHFTIIGLRLLQVILFAIGVTALMYPNEIGNFVAQLFIK